MRTLLLLLCATALSAVVADTDVRAHPTVKDIRQFCTNATPLTKKGMEALAPEIGVLCKPGFELVAIQFNVDKRVLLVRDDVPAEEPLLIFQGRWFCIAVRQLDQTVVLGAIDDALKPISICGGEDQTPTSGFYWEEP